MKKWILLTASLLACSGCWTKDKWEDVPLTESDVPYRIPPGSYVDVDGKVHEEKTEKWVLSDDELFDYVMWLKDK